MKDRHTLSLLLFLLLPAFPAESVEPEPSEKSHYHLFNPTPTELMRELSTDRPDRTESPYTVDAGHLQIEMSLLDYTYDHHNPDQPQTRLDNWSALPTNFKIGLLNNSDIQFVFNPYSYERTREDGERSSNEGFGDLQSRLKINLWGNDGGGTALALMPFIKFPTNNDLANDAVEGGVIIPLAVALPGDWGLGMMVEFDFNQDGDGDDYHTEYIGSITLAHAIIGNLNGYVEFFSNASGESKSPWVATVDTGLTYALSKDIQLDLGVNIGVTEAADDLNPFCGVSLRY